MAAEDDFVPEEIEGECTQCHKALSTVDRLLKPAMAVSKSKLEKNLSPLDSASLMLLFAYSMNSLFWVYLTTQGINPQNHPVKGELERIQKVMKRTKAIGVSQEPVGVRLDKEVAGRLIRGGLWEGGQDGSTGKKRKHTDSESTPDSKRIHND